MIYKSEQWGEDKVYAIATNFAGMTTIKEFCRGNRKSSLTVTEEDLKGFMNALEGLGFVVQPR
jgi:hypothetical protein